MYKRFAPHVVLTALYLVTVILTFVTVINAIGRAVGCAVSLGCPASPLENIYLFIALIFYTGIIFLLNNKFNIQYRYSSISIIFGIISPFIAYYIIQGHIDYLRLQSHIKNRRYELSKISNSIDITMPPKYTFEQPKSGQHNYFIIHLYYPIIVKTVVNNVIPDLQEIVTLPGIQSFSVESCSLTNIINYYGLEGGDTNFGYYAYKGNPVGSTFNAVLRKNLVPDRSPTNFISKYAPPGNYYLALDLLYYGENCTSNHFPVEKIQLLQPILLKGEQITSSTGFQPFIKLMN